MENIKNNSSTPDIPVLSPHSEKETCILHILLKESFVSELEDFIKLGPPEQKQNVNLDCQSYKQKQLAKENYLNVPLLSIHEVTEPKHTTSSAGCPIHLTQIVNLKNKVKLISTEHP